MSEFTIHTIESAPAEVKEVLETVQKITVATFPILSVFWPMRQRLWKLIGRLEPSIAVTA